jgi:hypothetical protein
LPSAKEKPRRKLQHSASQSLVDQVECGHVVDELDLRAGVRIKLAAGSAFCLYERQLVALDQIRVVDGSCLRGRAQLVGHGRKHPCAVNGAERLGYAHQELRQLGRVAAVARAEGDRRHRCSQETLPPQAEINCRFCRHFRQIYRRQA